MSHFGRGLASPFLTDASSLLFTYYFPHTPKSPPAKGHDSKFVGQPVPLSVLRKNLRYQRAETNPSTLRVTSKYVVKLSRNSHTSHYGLFCHLDLLSLSYVV